MKQDWPEDIQGLQEAWDKAEKELEFEFSELAGYIECGVVRTLFAFAYTKGFHEGRTTNAT